ncbi:MAG: type I-D CRISPR-associated endonuclease Cas1 [Chloroflexota bacterium]|nr:type I-D CRISPR-associated endonuclease Cas1 [Chloroflexota bacterium]
MSTLYVTEQHALVKKDGDTLIVQIPEDKCKDAKPPAEGENVQAGSEIEHGKKIRVVRVPLIKVDQVVVFGDATITSPALHALLGNRVEVCFLSYYGNFLGRLTPEFSKNSLIRLEQHRAHDDPNRALAFAKQFVGGKLSNLRTLLMRANRKLEDGEIERAVAALKGMIEKVERYQGNDSPAPAEMPTNPAVAVVNDLLGLEGMGSAHYFGVFGKLLKSDWGYSGRSKRPPTDPVNAMLSYGYTLLMHKAQSAIGVVGLDPYIGFLHSSQYGKPALALDLMEEFRGPIVDSVVITLINTGALKREDFVEEAGTFRMNDPARRTFLEKFEERLNTLIEHPTFGYKATYHKCLELQTRLLAKNLTGEIPAYPPFLVR